MSDNESSLEGSEHTAGGSQSEPYSRSVSPGNIDSPGTLGRDSPSSSSHTPLSLSSRNLMQPPSTRLPTPEVNARAEEIRQSLNNKARLWRDQCANIAPQLALLSTASHHLLNWNNGQFDPTSFLSTLRLGIRRSTIHK